jgi:hypothetical protein
MVNEKLSVRLHPSCKPSCPSLSTIWKIAISPTRRWDGPVIPVPVPTFEQPIVLCRRKPLVFSLYQLPRLAIEQINDIFHCIPSTCGESRCSLWRSNCNTDLQRLQGCACIRIYGAICVILQCPYDWDAWLPDTHIFPSMWLSLMI